MQHLPAGYEAASKETKAMARTGKVIKQPADLMWLLPRGNCGRFFHDKHAVFDRKTQKDKGFATASSIILVRMGRCPTLRDSALSGLKPLMRNLG